MEKEVGEVEVAVKNAVAAPIAGNFLSPGLNKCLDIRLEETTGDGSARETKTLLNTKLDANEKVNVQLYTCHGDFNQEFYVDGGKILAHDAQYCLEYEKLARGANVYLNKCSADAAIQKRQQR